MKGTLSGREIRAVRYLPHMMAATTLVVGVPTLVAIVLGGHYSSAVSTAVGVLLSLAFSRLGAWVWGRLPGARELEFSETVAWNWVRLLRAERRLARAARALGLDEQGNTVESATIGAEQRKRLLLDLNSALESKDPYTLGHTRRVARYSYWIAVKMRLHPDEVRAIRFAADVHDVGKLKVPDSILRKPARLTDEEFDVMKEHSATGADMVAALGDARITSIVRGHHERWDGRGYPDGLAGEDIPLGARIMAVADTYDAITTSRCYRSKSGHAKAVAILREEAGKQFDEAAVEAFLSHRRHRSSRLVALLSTGPWRLIEWALSGLRYGTAASLAQAGAVVVAASVVAGAAGPAAGSLAAERAERDGSARRTTTVALAEGSTDDPLGLAPASAASEVLDPDDLSGRIRAEGPEWLKPAPDSDGPGEDGSDPGAAGGSAGRDPGPGGPSTGNVGDGQGGGGSGSDDGKGPGPDVSDPEDSGSNKPGVGDVVDDVGDTVDDVADGVGDTVDDVVDGVGDTVDGVVDGAGDVVDGAGDTVGDVVDGVLGGLKLP
jgi:HD-GYP domain-containing protein (c-di-GMP phosphodiesterase class II)